MTLLSVYVCLLVCLFVLFLSFFLYLCSLVFLFASYSFPLYFFLPSQFISHDTQAQLLRKEFLKTPPLLVSVIQLLAIEKTFGRQSMLQCDSCAFTPAVARTFSVYRTMFNISGGSKWRVPSAESFSTFLLCFPRSLGPKSWIPTRTSSVKWDEPIMERQCTCVCRRVYVFNPLNTELNPICQ